MPAADGVGDTITAGDNASEGPWIVIAGAPLDWTWELRVTDLWGDHNGFLFSSSMDNAWLRSGNHLQMCPGECHQGTALIARIQKLIAARDAP